MTYDFASTKGQEYKEHIKVKACIEGSGENVVVPCPKLIVVVVCPVHYHKTTNDRREVSR